MQFPAQFRPADVLQAGQIRGLSADRLAELTELLRAYPEEFRPRMVEFLGGAGGFSGAAFWRLATDRGPLCLRAWPAQDDPGWPARLRLIHDVLQTVARRGTPPVPAPIHLRGGATFFQHAGRLWELTPWLPGVADYFPLRRPEKLRAALAALAEFHRGAVESSGGLNNGSGDLKLPHQKHTASPGILRRLERISALRNGQLERIVAAVESGAMPPKASDDDAWQSIRQQALRLVPLYRQAEPVVSRELATAADQKTPTQPCIRDIWHDHVLFEADRVSGLVDFGAMRIDNVACDIARLLGSVANDDAAAWHEGLAAYEEIRPLRETERQLAKIFDRSTTLLAGLNWLEWLFVEGRTFDDLPTIAERMAGIVERLQKVASG